MINHTINFAKKNLSKAFILVSSDSEKILKISAKNKGIHISKRLKKLSTDKALTYDVVKHELIRTEEKLNPNLI